MFLCMVAGGVRPVLHLVLQPLLHIDAGACHGSVWPGRERLLLGQVSKAVHAGVEEHVVQQGRVLQERHARRHHVSRPLFHHLRLVCLSLSQDIFDLDFFFFFSWSFVLHSIDFVWCVCPRCISRCFSSRGPRDVWFDAFRVGACHDPGDSRHSTGQWLFDQQPLAILTFWN